MRIYVLTESDLSRSVVDPRPTIEAEARVDQGYEKAIYWRHTRGNWELHSVSVEMAPRTAAWA